MTNSVQDPNIFSSITESKVVTSQSDSIKAEYNKALLYLTKVKEEYNIKKNELDLLKNSINQYQGKNNYFLYFTKILGISIKVNAGKSVEKEYSFKIVLIAFLICLFLGFYLSR